MRQVGVHLDQYLVAALESPAEAVAVRGAEAHRAEAPEHRDVGRMSLRRGLGEIGGAVGAAVVDDEQLRIGYRDPDVPQHRIDVVAFVVGGEDDERR